LPSNQYYNVDTEDLSSIGSCSSRGLPELRGKGLAKSAVGFRDQFAFLNARNRVSPSYRPFPGLLGDIMQRSRTSHAVPSGDSNDLFSPQPSGGEARPPHSIVMPDVKVTPDTRVVDHGIYNFWVAVEITATKGNGCLFDIKVDIEPTANSTILEVIESFSAPTTLSPGCAILALVNVEFNLSRHSRIRGHIRSSSDELIEDLEDQLGSAQCEYLTVSLVYQHSALAPSIDIDDSNSSGVTRAQTKTRTAYTAAVNRHNAASLWSPPPAPSPNSNCRLLGIIAAHWGVDAADELLFTKLTRRPTPRKTTYLGTATQHPSVASRRGRASPIPMRAAPAVPTLATTDENYRGSRRRRSGQQHHRYGGGDGESDQGSRIWAKIRRCSGLSLADRTNMSSLGGAEEQSLASKLGVPSKVDVVKGRKGSGRWGFGNWWA
jgi:hypothetical protein